MTAGGFHRGEGPAARPTDWNLPNALTVLRFFLVPVYGVLLFQDGGGEPWWRFWAWVVFALAAVVRVTGYAPANSSERSEASEDEVISGRGQ